jgi:hypothetical protein
MRIWSVVLAVVDGPSRGARATIGSEIAFLSPQGRRAYAMR